MSWRKKYTHLKPYKRVICVDPGNCVYLRSGIRGVIKEDLTRYLIQFTNGSAKWYSRTRFTNKIETKQKQQHTIKPLTNKLF